MAAEIDLNEIRRRLREGDGNPGIARMAPFPRMPVVVPMRPMPAVRRPGAIDGFLRFCLFVFLAAVVLFVAFQMTPQLFRSGSGLAGPAGAVRTAARHIVRPVPTEAPSALDPESVSPSEEAPEAPAAVVELRVPEPATAPEPWSPAAAPARPERPSEEPGWEPSPPPAFESVPPQPLQPLRLPPLPPLLLQQARGREVVVRFAVSREGRASFDSIESSDGLSTSVCKLLSRNALTTEWAPARDERGQAVHGIARVVIRP